MNFVSKISVGVKELVREPAEGLKEGKGEYVWADGSNYNGEWRESKINGFGQYIWNDGRKYYGTWLNNDMHGNGIYIYSDGVRYDG